MEAPGLGVESELQLPVYATATARPDPGCICDLCCPLWLCAIKAGIEPASSWTLCWVLNLMSHNRNCNLGFFFFFFFFFLIMLLKLLPTSVQSHFHISGLDYGSTPASVPKSVQGYGRGIMDDHFQSHNQVATVARVGHLYPTCFNLIDSDNFSYFTSLSMPRCGPVVWLDTFSFLE